jgi:hypothetical protein
MYNHGFSTSKANAGAAQKVDGGVILVGGTIASSRQTSKGIETVGYRSGLHGSNINTSLDGVQKVNNSGTLAKMVNGSYVMRRVTTTLAGVANTMLLSGSSAYFRRSIHKVGTLRTNFLRQVSWVADDEGGVTVTNTYQNSSYTLTDDAAIPTRAIPGEFTLKETGNNPVNKDYPAKT